MKHIKEYFIKTGVTEFNFNNKINKTHYTVTDNRLNCETNAL